jgi:hypothetical protein
MTERYTYALKTVMILYDWLLMSCQADFVTSFGGIKQELSIKYQENPNIEIRNSKQCQNIK